MAHNPTIDGLRGLAILCVVLFHLGLFNLGWLGVDLFFIISGHLITSILLNEHRRTGTINFRAFYFRRALRLLPALFVALAGYYLWFSMRAGISITKPLLASLFYFSNFIWIFQGIDELRPLAITWSLSVEEQFYLIWPFVLFVAIKQTRTLAITVGAISITGLLAWPFLASEDSAIGRLFWTRPDRILLGCSLSLLGISVCRVRALEIAPLIWLGKISYSLYLWHPIAIDIADRAARSAVLHHPPALTIATPLCLAMAAASYYCVERPFLRLKDRTARASPTYPRSQSSPPRSAPGAAAPYRATRS